MNRVKREEKIAVEMMNATRTGVEIVFGIELLLSFDMVYRYKRCNSANCVNGFRVGCLIMDLLLYGHALGGCERYSQAIIVA